MNWLQNNYSTLTNISTSTIGIYTFFNNPKKYEYALLNSAKIYDIMYDRVPKSELLCHWCRHSFETEPVFLPFNRDKNKKVHVKGYFCSFNCAKAFAIIDRVDASLLFEMYRTMKNIKAKYGVTLKQASPWQALKANGGIQTIEEFRKDFELLDKNVSYTEYPVVHSICQLKVINIEKIKTSNESFSIDDLPEDTKETGISKPKKGRKPKVVSTKKPSSLGILSSYLK